METPIEKLQDRVTSGTTYIRSELIRLKKRRQIDAYDSDCISAGLWKIEKALREYIDAKYSEKSSVSSS